ncbi:hypothetical protein PFICI_13225 [Pestalotiopsis fici W106-1]|uniref:Uncharacterized protein n=1 Tax=Pestalotiopsis fici (strain W106-1 / CGMCC3.15140) TaxID=1229662 RepID=W3WPK1_PESFW|nr:uncharacterized protein PFICI_13225 [Pestalotiopsis fici W106-1]ETS74741.1 hypothetical protein PFICI_13225 [Pestalotiopsis fici W106-1]
MKTTTTLLMGLFSLLPSALADAPAYCVPLYEVDQANTYYYYDESTACSSAGVGTNCCVTFITGGTCEPDSFTSEEVSNLESAVGQQVAKDGQFETSTVGHWQATFATLTTAIANQNVLTEWFHGINSFAAKPGSMPYTVQFVLDGDYMQVNYQC